ncbi:MAG: hypothetical protein KF760_05105 [Candidatus Eremiobacteraeota bacterium]|nr:hypothetical protein [Candidatus Eremiobacteraeota bacterium]
MFVYFLSRGSRRAAQDLFRSGGLSLVLCGFLAGVAVSRWVPPDPQAETMLLFPSINTPIFRRLQNPVASATPALESLALPPASELNVLELSAQVFRSRTAAQQVAAKVYPDAAPARLRELAWALHHGGLRVRPDGRAALRLRVSAAQPVAVLEAYLLYYREFLQHSALTNSKRARLQVERELARLDEQTRFLEQKLKSFRDFANPTGDSVLGVSGEVLKEVWSKRIQDSVTSQATADFFEELLLMESAPGTTPGSGPPRTRRTLDRVRLQRVYLDCVELRRGLLAEYAELMLLETLDSPDFEVVDAPQLVPASKLRLLWFGLAGALGAGLLFWLVRLLYWRRVLSALVKD